MRGNDHAPFWISGKGSDPLTDCNKLSDALRLLGDVAMHREPRDVDDAAAHYRQALALAEELGMRPLQAHCYDSLGTLHATVGQREQAHTALTTAIEMYRGMEITFWLPETEAKLEQLKR